MKCKFCGGSGNDIWSIDGVVQPCPVCGGTGECKYFDMDDKQQERKEPQTNEEWFCGLPTEEKAKAIVCLAVNAFHKKKKETDVDKIKQWLQEEHRDG